MFEIVAQEDGEEEFVLHEAVARKDSRGHEFAPDVGVAERARGVVIDTAAEHRFENKTFMIEAGRRPQHAAVSEAAFVPEIAVGKQKPARLIRARLERLGPAMTRHYNAQRHGNRP